MVEQKGIEAHLFEAAKVLQDGIVAALPRLPPVREVVNADQRFSVGQP
jgi:hypothetical protein